MVRADHKNARNRLLNIILKRLPTGPELGQSTQPKSRRVHELGSSYECRLTADYVPNVPHFGPDVEI